MHWQTSMHSLAALSSSPLCSSLQPLPHSHSLKLPSDQSLVWASVVFDESFEAVAKSQLKLNKILFSLLSVVPFVYLHCFFNKRNSISFSKNLTLHCYKRIVCITHTHTYTHTHTLELMGSQKMSSNPYWFLPDAPTAKPWEQVQQHVHMVDNTHNVQNTLTFEGQSRLSHIEVRFLCNKPWRYSRQSSV